MRCRGSVTHLTQAAIHSLLGSIEDFHRCSLIHSTVNCTGAALGKLSVVEIEFGGGR
jgi:hypothetical protein